ncbi:hypothetical protein N7539_003605 [Penicillium diatomitis]|uniref:Chromosome condensation protein n=1 Tax=Penicillium diatomitis TaxID=2819901 RepID=A0A9W9XC75_9EURO|nr:uncharacterized protein N7539_003605 [Penicillium diatomitis]KAJ5488715.1 hypothetical protein N7539_003605 [Penicillium diatomitis]
MVGHAASDRIHAPAADLVPEDPEDSPLTEVIAPEPVERVASQRSQWDAAHRSVEKEHEDATRGHEGRSPTAAVTSAASDDDYDPALTETTAPQPVAPTASQRQQWYSSRPAEDTTPVESAPATSVSKRATHLYTISYLVFFSIFGTLARLGLQALTFYSGAPVVTGVIWANVTGSFLMGFLIEDRKLFQQEWGNPPTPPSQHAAPRKSETEHDAEQRLKSHKAVKKTIPLYIGLTTGFCGCCTSFSSFLRDVFLALANQLPDPSLPPGTGIAPRNGGYSVMALLAVIILSVSLSVSALIVGAHLAVGLVRVTPTIPFKWTRRVVDRLMVPLAWGCWLGAVLLAIWPPDRHAADTWRGRAVFAVVFAPVGCLIRYYVSMALNGRVPWFPLGTFAVNMLGVAVEGLCYDLQHVSGLGAGVGAWTGCQVLQGLMDGFCGCLTTVSTWVAELNGVTRRRQAYFYGTVSVGVGLGLMVVIMGSLLWTRGFDGPVCG